MANSFKKFVSRLVLSFGVCLCVYASMFDTPPFVFFTAPAPGAPAPGRRAQNTNAVQGKPTQREKHGLLHATRTQEYNSKTDLYKKDRNVV